VNVRGWISWIGGAVALLAGFVTIVQSQPEGTAEPLGMAWSRPMRGTIALAVSPRGERVLAADGQGLVRCYDQRGSVLWERRIPETDSLSVSRDGSLCLAYAARQPLARTVTILDGNGSVLAALPMREPIEMAAVAPDGQRAAVAAGRSLLFCSRRRDGLHFREARVTASPRQVQFGPGDTLYLASEQPASVCLVKSSGKVLWRRPAVSATPPSISASADGRFVAIGTEEEGDNVQVALLDWQQQTQWSRSRPGRAPQVRLCASGTAVVLSYEHRVAHNAQNRFEQRLAYLAGTPEGAVEEPWTKGGAYTAPLYLSVGRQGDWVVALDMQQPGPPSFRLYGRGGERRWFYTSPTNVLIATASTEGRHIATYRTDGAVEMVRVAVP